MEMESEILLESGTNELEILEFTIGNCIYGINVAKVAEAIKFQKITPVPASHPAVAGILKPREDLLTAIDLSQYLFGKSSPDTETKMLIITNFNQQALCFIVDSVKTIHRFSWTDVIKPNGLVSNADNGIITGVIAHDDYLVSILDFEKIVTDINPNMGLKTDEIEIVSEEKKEIIEKRGIRLMLAEDSQMLMMMLKDTLKKAGFDIIACENGQIAYDNLESLYRSGNQSTISLLITDIEMPEMDGITLSKKLKTEGKYDNLPIIIFSSLIDDALCRKLQDINIDAMITKPELGQLVSKIDELLKL